MMEVLVSCSWGCRDARLSSALSSEMSSAHLSLRTDRGAGGNGYSPPHHMQAPAYRRRVFAQGRKALIGAVRVVPRHLGLATCLSNCRHGCPTISGPLTISASMPNRLILKTYSPNSFAARGPQIPLGTV